MRKYMTAFLPGLALILIFVFAIGLTSNESVARELANDDGYKVDAKKYARMLFEFETLARNLQNEDIKLTLRGRGRRLAGSEPSVLQSLREGLGRAVVRIDVTGNYYDPQVTTTTLPVIKGALELLGTKENDSND